MDASANTFSNITPLHTYMKLVHTPSPVHSLHFYPPIPAPHHTPIFTYGTSYPPSPLHDFSAESVTPKVNTTPRKTPTNPVPNIPAEPDSDPILSYSSTSESSNSSDNE